MPEADIQSREAHNAGAPLRASVEETAPRTAQRAAGTHAIDYRISLPLFGTRLYFVMLAGVDQRAIQRVRRDGQLRSLPVFAVKALLLAFLGLGALSMVLGFGVIALYVLKSALGINLFESHSFLHPFVY